MDKARRLLQRPQTYDAIREDNIDEDETDTKHRTEVPFTWIDYSIFLLIGIAMLWAWSVNYLPSQCQYTTY